MLNEIKLLPKILLHDHLDGGLRPDTMISLAKEIEYGLLPSQEPEQLSEWVYSKANSGSLAEYLKVFDLTCALMQTEEALERVAYEMVIDLSLDGIVYAESRWAPEQHLENGISPDNAVEAVKRGILAGEATCLKEGRQIQVNQIISVMRQNDNADEMAKLALRHRQVNSSDHGAVVGLDFAGPENGFPLKRFQDVLNFVNAENLPVTLHAGEEDSIESISEAIHLGNAQRIGHGIAIAEEDSKGAGSLAEWMRNRRLPIEFCPSSNIQTHKDINNTLDTGINIVRDNDIPITISTDNRLVSGTKLSYEMVKMITECGWNMNDLFLSTLHAARNIFAPYKESRRIINEIVVPAWKEYK
jgi:adenosine deaminase